MKRRVVVTGLGIVSAIGMGKDEFWNKLIAGQSGISEIETFDTSEYPTHKGGEIKNFDPKEYIQVSKYESMGRASQFAVVATKFALEDARVKLEPDSNTSFHSCFPLIISFAISSKLDRFIIFPR